LKQTETDKVAGELSKLVDASKELGSDVAKVMVVAPKDPDAEL
jgi:hypothetical protein